MEYIRSKNKEQYCKESLDLSFNIGNLIKDPNAKIRNIRIGMLYFGLCTLALIILAVPMSMDVFKDGSLGAIIFACVVYAFIVIFGLAFVLVALAIQMRKKQFQKAQDEKREFDCDKDGVSYIMPEQKVTAYWNSLQAIRVFTYTIVLIPKDKKTIAIMAPVENLENLTAFMNENNIQLPVIK